MIHKYSLNGCNIALDVNSGAVHIFDDLSYRMLGFFEDNIPTECEELSFISLKEYSKEDILSAFNELSALCNEGLLFSPDYEIKDLDKYIEDAPVKAMCIHIAHDCNLKCEYCFASKGDFGQGRKLMDFETGKKAIDFVIDKSKSRRNIEIDFFGGEPLMNFETVKKIVEYAREKEKEFNKNFRFTITTNGVLLDKSKIDYINREMCNAVLSLDGRKEVNDWMRKRADNTGSYDTILPKFKELVENRNHDNYYIRGTFTKHNLDFANDVLDIVNSGFLQVSIEPVVCEEDKTYALTEADLPRIFEEYEKLAKLYIERKKAGKGFNFFHFMIDLDSGPCAIKRVKGCGCGNEYIAVTPEGDIYPCHQFVGKDEYKMGNVHTGEFDLKIKKYFSSANVTAKAECKTCFAKNFCSGGCNANNYAFNGDILKPHRLSCELQRKRIECALMIKAALL